MVNETTANSFFSVLVPTSENDSQEVFGIFEEAGREVGATLQVIDIAKVVNANAKPAGTGSGNIQDMTISLKYAGIDYQRFKKLLRHFEILKRLTDVTALSFDPVGQFAGFTVKVYYTQEQKK
jgi:hypothetical protein